ncbi:MAG: hypothetical protein ROY99_03140 [Ignavibacterium sp.]|jgi:uncharacterized protein YcfL|nr:hypothetical protein [Ignavibacterium sp.]
MIKKTILVLSTVVLVGCNKENPIDPGQSFQIVVYSQDGQPVEGAIVEGGIDWDHFQVRTNADGEANLPGSIRGGSVAIYKTNYLPVSINNISPAKYTLKKTTKKLEPVGDVSGKAIRFDQNKILTLDYNGTYHFYTYNNQGVTEAFSTHLHDSINAVRETKLYGDTLWLSTHNSGLFAFSIQNPSSPNFLFRISIQGYLGPFVVMDSLIALGHYWSPGPLKIIAYKSNGSFRELSSVKNYFVLKMTGIGSAIILIGNSDILPTIFDISNPVSPQLLYNGLEWEYQTGFFYKKYAVLTPKSGWGGDNIHLDYKIMDLSDPAVPVAIGLFSADSWITGIVSDNSAVGNYYYHSQTFSVLEGSISSGFQTVATVSGNSIDGFAGSNPPYYLIGNRLWKLMER